MRLEPAGGHGTGSSPLAACRRSSATSAELPSIAVAAMLKAEELFVALARDAVAIPVATAFARVALAAGGNALVSSTCKHYSPRASPP